MTRESLIAISYSELEKEPTDNHSTEKLRDNNGVEAVNMGILKFKDKKTRYSVHLPAS